MVKNQRQKKVPPRAGMFEKTEPHVIICDKRKRPGPGVKVGGGGGWKSKTIMKAQFGGWKASPSALGLGAAAY